MGGFSPAASQGALARAVLNGVWAQLHTGDPGSDGTANAASGIARAAVVWSGTATQTATTTFSMSASADEYSHISLWDSSDGGTFQGSATLDVSGTPTSVTFSVDGSTLTVAFTAQDAGVLS